MAPRPNTDVNGYRNIRVVAVVVLVLTGLFFWPSIRYRIAIIEMGSSHSAITIGLTLHEIDETDIPNLDLKDWQKQYLTRHEVPLSLVSLDYIYVPENLISPGDSVCINEIKILNESSLGAAKDVIYLVNKNEDYSDEIDTNASTGQQEFCFGAGKNVILPKYFQVAPIAYAKYIDPFLYPFDTREINYSLSSQLYYKNSEKNLGFDTEVLMSVSPPRWIANTILVSRSEEKKSLKLRTTIYRFSLVKVLSIILPISVLLIIIMLPRIIKDEAGSFWEVIVGLILGLWGLSQVLIPSYIDYPTLIEAFILILYVVIGIFVLAFGWHPPARSEETTVDPNSSIGDIPDNESLENLFVWAIKKINSGMDSTKVAEALFTKASNERLVSYKKKLIEVAEKILKA